MTGSIKARSLHTAGTLAFVFMSALVVMTASERVYWYWGFAGASPGEIVGGTLEGALFYSVPMAAALWAMAKTPVRSIHQLVLTAAVFAFVVEGVLTAVIFEGGPIDPILPAMFIGWHGLLAMIGFWYLTRRWLVEHRRVRLGVAAGVVGVFWGLWSTNSWLPANLADIEPGLVKTIADPGAFAIYAVWVGALFIAGHWILGRLWRPKFDPGRAGTVVLAIVLVGLHAVVALAVPWAPLKLVAMLGFVAWMLMRSRDGSTGSTVLEQLDGPVRFADAATLGLMPIAAATTYAIAWALKPSEGVLEVVFFALVLAQIVTGSGVFVWAVVGSVRSKHADVVVPKSVRRGPVE